ncbi:ankyrin repeat domain-containing protein [Noviherbaspirillum pedocola]|nr:ankyrin repeat domain-containing protein [Noviherbaspirillum pedocola]
MVRRTLTREEFNAACKVVQAGEDAEQALNILFGAASKRPAGTFFVRILYELPPSGAALVAKCGGCFHAFQATTLVLHCADFDLDRLMREYEAVQSAENNNGFTALMLAAQWGDQDLVSQLLSRGAKLAARTNKGRTALMFAVISRNVDIARLLLRQGADVHAITNDHNCAMTYAASTGDVQLCELLRKHGALIDPEPDSDSDDDDDNDEKNIAPIISAAESGETDACIWLVGQGASIETTWRGSSALLVAAFNGHLDTCKALIALGAKACREPERAPFIALCRRRWRECRALPVPSWEACS